MTYLEVSGLTVRTAGDRTLVRDVSFALDRGDRLGLIGASGAGKTLIALSILGLLPRGLRAEGRIRLDGTDVLGAPERRLNRLRGRAVTAVFQESLAALDPLMRLGAQVAQPLRHRQGLRGKALRAAVVAALESVRLADPERMARAYPHEVSGGQRQRVAIAMALACEPALLIADEPTSSLDTTVQAEVLGLLDRLIGRTGAGLLFIGHDLAVVAGVARRLLVLDAGQAVESGPVAGVLSAPAHPRTQELVGTARRLRGALERMSP
ncbi:ABC transporter ATP-binding protein [Streptosporangiaceae bacterium NEAU-GS5]|nr:ABC transporter ATP-binding protein [Streptosporangiaceae bacterium NEAU-GS5]